MSITAMKLALETFERMNHEDSIFAGEFDEEITALRQAIAEAEKQKPVAWMHTLNGDVQINKLSPEYYGDHWKTEPLYTTPQPQREPLTDEAIATVYWGATGQSLRPQDNALAHKFARAIEAAHGIKEQP